ncbi:hypothetical protein ColLi_09133 [Colletotrichum liriopes]|uniref:Ulp1 protease family protein n=1 Tax=Colletotrichum liriopes TaxID=708192 RepID=A0AA37GT46_9PEZI|nr:hypothetical protein ColLi_09133 [Colletotrichum liriopes]
MTVLEVVAQLNSIERLATEFRQDADFANESFPRWAFTHIDRRIITIAVDDWLRADVAKVTKDSIYRLASFLKFHSLSLATFIFLFGLKVTKSRPCVVSLVDLQKAGHSVGVIQIYDAFAEQPTTSKTSHLLGPVRRFQLAVQSLDPNARSGFETRKVRSRAQGSSRPSPTPSSSPELSRHIDKSHESHSAAFSNVSADDAFNNNALTDDDISMFQGDFGPNDDSASDSESIPESPRSPKAGQSWPSTPLPTPESLFGFCSQDGQFEFKDLSTIVEESDVQHPAVEELTVDEPAVDEPAVEEHIVEEHTIAEPAVDEPSVDEAAVNEAAAEEHTVENHRVGESTTIASKAAEGFLMLPIVNGPFQQISKNITVRPIRKRSLKQAMLPDCFESSPDRLSGPSKRAKQLEHQRLPVLSASSVSLPAPQEQSNCLQLAFHSLGTLDDGKFLNDEIINNLARRLVSTEIGIIESLTLSCNQMTERGRLRLLGVMGKAKVLLFFNHNCHWVLFEWTPIDNILQEYNSLPSGSSCTGGDTIPQFLQWVYNEPSLCIVFRKPKQPNLVDCGVYVLCFAEHIASGKPLPENIDGSRERIYLRQQLFTSRHRTLSSEELGNLPMTVPRKQRAKTPPSIPDRSSDRNWDAAVSRMTACREASVERQAALAAVVFNFHKMHRNAITLAQHAEAQMKKATETRDHWLSMRNAARIFQEGYSRVAKTDVPTSLDPPGDILRHCKLINELFHMAGRDLDPFLDEDQGRCAEFQRMQDAARHGYLECSTLLVILNYAVQKFRTDKKNIAEVCRKVEDILKALQGK